jgi:hypothetical protein
MLKTLFEKKGVFFMLELDLKGLKFYICTYNIFLSWIQIDIKTKSRDH